MNRAPSSLTAKFGALIEDIAPVSWDMRSVTRSVDTVASVKLRRHYQRPDFHFLSQVKEEGLIKSTGRMYRQDYVLFLRTAGGKIAFLREYFDPVRLGHLTRRSLVSNPEDNRQAKAFVGSGPHPTSRNYASTGPRSQRQFIECYYNRERLHSAFAYRSPQEFEEATDSSDAASVSIVAKLKFAHEGNVHIRYSLPS